MKNTNKKQWLCVHNWVYASMLPDIVMLYNTRNGQFITTKDHHQIYLVSQLHERNNLGTILIDNNILQDPNLSDFIKEAQQKDIFSLIEYCENQIKPVQLMPVLNIQRDVEKLKKEPDRSLGEEIICYLTELTMYVSS